MADIYHQEAAEHLIESYNALDGLPGQPFTHCEILFYYDGPKGFWFTTSDDRALLVQAADETDEDYVELGAFVTPEALAEALRGDVPFREPWTNASAEDLYLIHYPVDDDIEVWVEHAPHPLPESMLPTPEARL